MTQPINLGRARKVKAKAEQAASAAANRVKFGRTKAEKQADKAAAERAARVLDQAKRES